MAFTLISDLLEDILPKVCGHSSYLLSGTATPISNRGIKSSIEPCYLHRQTLAIEDTSLRDQYGTFHEISMTLLM